MGMLSQKISFSHDSNILVNIGKHKGTKWRDVPLHYLQWMILNVDMGNVGYKHAEAEIERRMPGKRYYGNR